MSGRKQPGEENVTLGRIMDRIPRLDFLKWFYPGMHIKRWLALMVIGVAVMTFGLAYILREAYVSGFTFPGFMYYVTLQFIPRYIRGAMFMVGSAGVILLAVWKLNQSIRSEERRVGKECRSRWSPYH